MTDTSLVSRLATLAELHSAGALDDQEFTLAKRRLLDEARFGHYGPPGPMDPACRVTVRVTPRPRWKRLRHAGTGRWADVAVSAALGAVILGILVLTVVVGVGVGGETPSLASASPPPSSPSSAPTAGTTRVPDFTAPSADGLVSVVPDAGTTWPATVSAAVVQTFDSYFAGINSGDHASAYAAFSPQLQARVPLTRLISELPSTQDSAVTVHAVSPASAVAGVGPVRVAVTFTSEQAPDMGPAPGETCTHWDLTYRLIPAGKRYLIDGVSATTGEGHTPC